MATKVKFLRTSSTGWYEYRRRVPEKLSLYFPRTKSGKLMREWKKALDTKDEKIALKRWIAEDARFEAAVEIANKYLNEENFTPSEAIQL